jgi:LacI family transcriptional regulator
MKDIAQKAHVSTMTVSRILKDPHTIYAGPETRARVLRIANECGYVMHSAAQMLRTGFTPLVSLYIPQADNLHYAHIAAVSEQLALQRGFQLMVRYDVAAIANDDPLSDLQYAIICVDRPVVLDYYLHRLRHHQPALRLIEMTFNTPVVPCSIFVDLGPAVREALDDLHDSSGGSEVYYLHRDMNVKELHKDIRFRSYTERVRQWGQPERLLVAFGDSTRDAYEAVCTQLNTGVPLGALFCHNDRFALGALHALHDAGLRVPQDCVLAACDGTDAAEFATPGISTIAFPIADMCQAVWRILDDLDNPTGMNHQVQFAGTYLRRPSTFARCIHPR